MSCDDGDGYDAHCVNCGAGYCYEVGSGGDACPNCGRSRTQTPQQKAEKARRDQEEYAALSTGQPQKASLLDEIDSLIAFGPHDSMPEPMKTKALQALRECVIKIRAI